MKGFVLGGTGSGVGKTVATLATIRAIERTGRDVQPAKVGPDFIDPSHHAAVAGRPSRTLDTWLQGEEGVRRNYYRGEGDICVAEGVMGMYDGVHSSTAAVAEALDLPVVLVLDAQGGMESVAATALGFQEYATAAGRNVDVVGVIASRAHGGRHAEGIEDALPGSLTYFGRIPPRSGLEIPERHLGLLGGTEAPVDPDDLDAAAEYLRVDGLLDAARSPPTVPPASDRRSGEGRIAVARDDAFRFVYPATLERLRDRGAVATFSPVAGDDVPACDGVYLPGGYPELHAATLASGPTLEAIGERASDGLPVLGECGGMMALADTLTTTEGETHDMAGVLPIDVTMHDQFQALDHVELAARSGTPIAEPGDVLRGHEFHYSSAEVATDARFAFDVRRGEGIDGDRDGLFEHQTLGTYCHLHAESGAFDAFVDSL